jgi:hypothetical protein
MKNQFWAGSGSRAVLEKKKFGADYEQLLRPVFLMFSWTKNKFKLKLHRIRVKKVKIILGSIFYGGKTNFNVSTRTL